MTQLVLCLIFTLFFAACSSTEKLDISTAEGAYKMAQSLEKDERFEEAISYYVDIKNKHPYSRFAVASKMAVANIHYKRNAFAEAETSYKLIKEFHPNHKQIDFVTFRLAMSYFKQMPEEIDRDLSSSQNAITYFDEVSSRYPKSDYAGSARDHKKFVYRLLAKRELYVANFYFHQKLYDSALGRYESLWQKYKNLGLNLKALNGATLSAIKSKNRNKAKKFLALMSKEFPKSNELKKAKQAMADTYGK